MGGIEWLGGTSSVPDEVEIYRGYKIKKVVKGEFEDYWVTDPDNKLFKVFFGKQGKEEAKKAIELADLSKIPKATTEIASLSWHSISELKQMCRQRGLSTEGSKEDLIRRLRRP